MEIRHRLLVIRGTALAALAVCAALLMSYLLPESRLCGFDFDCDEVLSSRFAKVAGVPLPIIGMLGFAVLLACSLSSQARWGRLLRYLALAAGLAGLALISIQVFVLHRICPFCLMADTCALVIAYATFGWRGGALPALPGRARHLWLGAAAAALVLGAALGWASSWRPAEEDTTVPPQVAAHWLPYKVNLVEIMDFQCPHCRAMHQVLTRFLDEKGEEVHYVRIVAPMAKDKHPQASDAARAYLCAQAQGQGEAMAEDLFRSEDLSSFACEQLAAALGLDKRAYQTCVASAETEKQIDANLDWVVKACPKGLPCLWVQDQRLSGFQTGEVLRQAVASAEKRLQTSVP